MLANLLKAIVALAAMQVQHPQRRREAPRFLAPVVHEGRRQDDQRGPVQAAAFLLGEDMG